MTFSHGLAVWGHICLYLPVSAGCSDARGGGWAKAIGQVPGRAGSGDMAPTSLVPSSCSRACMYFYAPAAALEA